MRGGRTCQMTRLPVPTPCLAVRNRSKRDYLLVWKALGILRTRDLPESNEPPHAQFDDFTHCFWFLASMPVVLGENSQVDQFLLPGYTKAESLCL